MKYNPTSILQDPAAQEELQRLAELLATVIPDRLAVLSNAPVKFKDGQIAIADGDNWDPLSDGLKQPVWYNTTLAAWQAFGGGAGGTAWASITGTPTSLSGYGITDGATDGELSAAISGLSTVYQPLSAVLTTYAGGDTPSAFTLSIVDAVDAAAFRTAIGAGTSSFNGAFSSLSGIPTTLAGYGISDAQPLDTQLTAWAGGDTPSAFTLGIVDSADAAAWRTAIGAGTSSFSGAYGDLSGTPTLSHGTYTPTATLGTNMVEATPDSAQWLRVGNTVTVSGRVSVRTGGSNAFMYLSLPVASSLGDEGDLAGAGTLFNASGNLAAIALYADFAGDRALYYLGGATAPSLVDSTYTYTYRVI